MRGVVLAAGRGTRLAPLTKARPKALVELGGRPLVTHALDAVVALGAERLILVVGSDGDEIQAVLGGSYADVPVRYVRQIRPEGPAHALLAAEAEIEGGFLAVHGDNVFQRPQPELLRRHGERRPDATLLVESVAPERARQAVCRVSPRGRVLELVEHPGPADREVGRIAAGLYALEPSVFDACRRVEPSVEGERELTDALNLLVREGRRVAAVPLEGHRVNVNTPRDLDRARRMLSGNA